MDKADMIERGAEALYVCEDYILEWEETSIEEKRYYRTRAEAVIDALRLEDMTEEMRKVLR